MITSTLYMMCGIPGSGKTTFREKNFSGHEYVHISSDDIIEKIATLFGITYNDVFEDQVKFAGKIIQIKVKQAIKTNKNIVWDQTNLTVNTRKKKLTLFPKNYRKVAYIFPTPDEEELKRRLDESQRQTKIIPPEIIRKMKEMFVYPTEDEGFSEIHTYNTTGEF